MMGELVRYPPSGKVKFTNGWISIWRTSWPPHPANDHCWLMSAPITHGPCMVSATAAGPALHFPEPRMLSVAVGNVKVGPTPQMSAPGLPGERNRGGLRGPRPNALSAPGAGDGGLMMGRMGG